MANDLTNPQWETIRRLIPATEREGSGARGGRPWRDPPPQTRHRRFQKWTREGVLDAVLRTLGEDLRQPWRGTRPRPNGENDMRSNGMAKGILAAALLLVGGGAARAQEGRGPPPTPPAEAVRACQGAADGATCKFTMGDRSMSGTCRTSPDGQSFACAPPHRGPPPEAFQACQSLAEGSSCTVSIQGQSMSGTCRSGPGGGQQLACAPAGGPPQR